MCVVVGLLELPDEFFDGPQPAEPGGAPAPPGQAALISDLDPDLEEEYLRFVTSLASGARINLCARPAAAAVKCLIDTLYGLGIAEAQAASGPAREPLERVLRAFLPTARCLVVERDYFDLDYRSEVAATHETSFAARGTKTDRFHFFAATADQGLDLADAVRGLKTSYLGYLVLRPQAQGAVGRALIPDTGSAVIIRASPDAAVCAPGDSDTGAEAGAGRGTEQQVPIESELTGLELRSRIRTHVTEWVEVFGHRMSAKGVPFMQQDGHLLRCAHVSAWIAHYTAVLRSYTARRSTANFHAAEEDTGTYGRRYPSAGLTGEVMSSILRRLDLPPEVLYSDTLEESDRPLGWHDRESLKEAEFNLRPGTCTCERCGDGETAHACKRNCGSCTRRLGAYKHLPDEDEVEWRRTSLTENLTATVCRYLNSGMPVILAEENNQHTRVIVGYLRRSDPLLGGGADSEVGAFILQDDEERPFRIETVESILDSILTGPADSDGDRNEFSLIVPLPRGVWMSGARAEAIGVEVLRHFLDPHHEVRSYTDSIDFPDRDKLLNRIDATLSGQSAEFAVRSYVANGSDFKVSMRKRTNDQHIAKTIAMCRLPKFVWVVEMIDRERRGDTDTPRSVVATVVLDATAASEALSGDADADDLLSSRRPVLFVHAPGVTVRWLQDPEQRIDTAIGPMVDGEVGTWHYESGRWGHSSAVSWSSPAAFAQHAKNMNQ